MRHYLLLIVIGMSSTVFAMEPQLRARTRSMSQRQAWKSRIIDSVDAEEPLKREQDSRYADIEDPSGIRPPMESYDVACIYNMLGKRDCDEDYCEYKSLEKEIRKNDQIYRQERSALGGFLEQKGVLKPKKSKSEYFKLRYSPAQLGNHCPEITMFCRGEYRFYSASMSSEELIKEGLKRAVIRILLENGCDPNPPDHPLVVALANENPGAIELLIQHGSHIQHAGLSSLLNSIGDSEYEDDVYSSFFPSLKRMRQELMFKAARALSIPIMGQLIEIEGEGIIQNRIGHALFTILKKLRNHQPIAERALRFLLAHGANPFYKSFYHRMYGHRFELMGPDSHVNRSHISPYKWFSKDGACGMMSYKRQEFVDRYLAIMKEGRRQYLKPFVIKFAVLLKWLFEKQLKKVSFIPTDVALHIGSYCCDGYPEN